MNEDFFKYPSPLNSSSVREAFTKTLSRHGNPVESEALDELFHGIELMAAGDNSSNCPFPFVRTVKAAKSHAKKLKNASNKKIQSLGKAQQIFAEFYGYGKWSFFTEALEKADYSTKNN